MPLLMDIQVPMITDTFHQLPEVREMYFGYWDPEIESFLILQVTAQAQVGVTIDQMPQNILNGTNNEIPAEVTLPIEEQTVPLFFTFTPQSTGRILSGVFTFRIKPVTSCPVEEE